MKRSIGDDAFLQREQTRTPPFSTPAAPWQLPGDLAPSTDLTYMALNSDGPYPLRDQSHYQPVYEQVVRGLHRCEARHVLLVGERGVGKISVVAELARRAAVGEILSFRDKRFLAIDCRFVTVDESRERLQAIFLSLAGRHPLTREPLNGRDSNHDALASVLSRLVVCFDAFAALLRSDRGGTNVPTLLSCLNRLPLQVIGTMAPHEYEELVAGNAEMHEFFSVVDVQEPDPDTALPLVRHAAHWLQEKFKLTVEDEAIRQAVRLSANYVLNDRLPAKAIRVLHRVCEDVDYNRQHLANGPDTVGPNEVVSGVSQITGVPEDTLRGISDKVDYRRSLSELIVGQQHVVDEVAQQLGLIKAGLTDSDKPASVMMFVGQTGTGKTEMAKALARFYSASKRLRIYTLGNFVEPHSIAGLIGVPPGYVGHELGGRLINDLNSDPYGVFLLDEADKAHPDVLQPFLNLFDEGWVRDQRGTHAFANRSIFILTTNVGQRMLTDMARQGKTPDEMAARMKEVLPQIRHGKSNRPVFAPEFLARINRIIVFQPLDEEALKGIAGRIVADQRDLWSRKRQKNLSVGTEVIELIGVEAHRRNVESQGREGGRIVRKLIRHFVEIPIERAIGEQPDAYMASEKVVVEPKFTRLEQEVEGNEPAWGGKVFFR